VVPANHCATPRSVASSTHNLDSTASTAPQLALPASEPPQPCREVAPELALPVSESPQPLFKEMPETEASLSDETKMIIVDHTQWGTSHLQPKCCCWTSSKNHLEQYERLAARYTQGSNVLCIQHILALTEEYHPSMNKEFSKTALEFFVNHYAECTDNKVVIDSMHGLEGNEEFLHFLAFNFLAEHESFHADQVMQDFVPALQQIRNSLWLEEQDFIVHSQRDHEDWQTQIIEILSAVFICLNVLVIGITVDMPLTVTERSSLSSFFAAVFVTELVCKLYVFVPTSSSQESLGNGTSLTRCLSSRRCWTPS